MPDVWRSDRVAVVEGSGPDEQVSRGNHGTSRFGLSVDFGSEAAQFASHWFDWDDRTYFIQPGSPPGSEFRGRCPVLAVFQLHPCDRGEEKFALCIVRPDDSGDGRKQLTYRELTSFSSDRDTRIEH
ncbi:MAG TPA: hypothetical protein VHA14_07920 [Bryobacteraceae bacterium]|nr:hypothetical protein [Bryobacteraceae bacterium]